MRYEESDEQRTVAHYLRLRKALFCAVPNGGHRNRVTAAIMKGEGVQRGVPDLLIFEQTPHMQMMGVVGIAIEMKRREGGKLTADQERWLAELKQRKWAVAVCRGADEAIRYLKSMGV